MKKQTDKHGGLWVGVKPIEIVTSETKNDEMIMENETPKTALIFPGKGSQFAGMGKQLYESFPPTQEFLDQACQILDFDLKEIIFVEDDDALPPTKIAQPAMYVCDSLFFELLRSKEVSFEAAVGHSPGEYAALYSAGFFPFMKGLQLVSERGRLMQEACDLHDGGMAAVVGFELRSIQDSISTAKRDVAIASLNAKNQVVISGL